ncbi:PAS domain S-box protein [Desulfobulbus alkaliphilus]|uniref:PAS domain S-box protein n=1 Tax=Desulfobulbus alkaliphilus TaxID=869814 RepID=UPI001962B0ED|nr:PAS domain S-box protein [Desulfobulbus alkaliphilus]MBM9538277.1 PAS domain S-box protein [Desulfobulbus alkaliphilus]
MNQQAPYDQPASKRERLLMERIQNLLTLINSSPDAALLMDTSGTMLAVNKALAAQFGVSATELPGSNIYHRLPPELAASRRQQIEQALVSGQTVSFQDQHDGRFFAHDLHPVRNRKGVLDRLAVFSRDITAAKRMEHLLEARLQLSETATALSMEDLLADVLDHAEALTGSHIGFFHFVEPDQETISLQVWSRSTMARGCRLTSQKRHYPIEQAGVWIDCLHTRRPIIHNDYASLPHRMGLPPNHAEVRRELLVPIIRGEKVVAVFGVGNKKKKYDQEDIDTITSLGDLTWDIVLRKGKEQALQQSEERFRRVFDLSPVGMAMVGLDFYFLKVNDSFSELIGYSESELRTMTFADITHPEERVRDTYQVRRLARGEIDRYEVEKRYRHKNGATIWARVTVSLIHDNNHEPLFFLPIIKDITKRKHAEAALRRNEERYRMQIELAMDGILLSSPQWTITAANRSLCLMLGMEEKDILGRHIRDLPFTPESLQICPFRLDLLKQGEIVNSDRVLIRADNTLVPVEMRTGRLPDGSYQSIVRDITERKQYEHQLADALREKEVLLREVHHRVKNNLAAIISLMDLQRRNLEDAHGQVILTELSNRIRTMSLIHEKLYRADSLASIDFQDYTQALMSHLRTTFGSPDIICRVEAHGVTIPLDLASPCGLIVNELVTNALKYAFPEGKPHPGNTDCQILVRLLRNDVNYTLTVADNGIGWPTGFDWTKPQTLGMILVRMLGQHQLRGQYLVDQNNGTSITLTFSDRKKGVSVHE